MSKQSQGVAGKLRVRANGLVVKDDCLLLVELKTPILPFPYWMPPGGGLQFGEALQPAVEREVREETGVIVYASQLMYVHEYINVPWHAVEFYFWCDWISGEPSLGIDPERSVQYLQNAAFIPLEKLSELAFRPEFMRDCFLDDIHLIKSKSFSVRHIANTIF